MHARDTEGVTAQSTDETNQQTAHRHDLAVASKVWTWLTSRPDVLIGADRAFNHLSLDQVLALPEEDESASSGTAVETSSKGKASISARGSVNPEPSSRTTKDGLLTTRPRLHVSEERQWRTITGHGPDLKRVPLFEWRALVDIASVKEKGILQGDLVRLTGQDKRSLPTRTDALARKGYVIKQPIVLRGGKSSKLWLAQFSEFAKEDVEPEGLDYDQIDLSKAALTSDLQPVPFCDKWNREHIDYLSLAQAFVAVVKAWSLIRYCDARAKLGVEERVRQMRALAKACRWLTNIGALSFVGAKFAGSNRLFKDCVKYMRDPTPAEWSHFRATPKTRMVVPSGRIGKRGEASRAVHASLAGEPRGKFVAKKRRSSETRNDLVSYASIIPPPWKPQKPVPNTAFEIIKAAGSKGTSNAAICRQTLGPNYRRLTAAMTGSISMPTNSQPSHLKHLSSSSKLRRIGKTMTYTFYANSEIAEAGPDEQQTQGNNATTVVAFANPENMAATRNDGDFSQLDAGQFSGNLALSLTHIARNQQLSRASSRKTKRKRSGGDELEGQPPAKLPRRLGRPPARVRKVVTPGPVEKRLQSGTVEASATAQQNTAPEQDQHLNTCEPIPRPPGVYRGVPNSLDPPGKRKGRKRRSLVIIFRSDKLKDPSFLGGSSRKLSTDDTPSPGSEAGTKAQSGETPAQTQAVDSMDTSHSVPAVQQVALNSPSPKPMAPKVGKNGLFWCDKCGNSWKNSNGLEYHLSKSKTTCNANFVSASLELISSRKRKPTQPKVLEPPAASDVVYEEQTTPRLNLTPKEQVESRINRRRNPPSSRTRVPADKTTSTASRDTISESSLKDAAQLQAHQGPIILKELEVYNAAAQRRRASRSTSGTNKGNLEASTIIPSPAFTNANHARRPNRSKQQKFGGYREHSPTPSANPIAEGLRRGSVESAVLRRDLHTPGSTERSSARKPLPSARLHKPNGSKTFIRQSRGAQLIRTGADTISGSSADHSIDQNPTKRPLASFAKEMRPNASFGARRRQRTTQIIEYLLHHNDGVFPGLRSLFMAVISVWAKEFQDLAPPDRRICQNTANQMERDGVLKQMHFFFFDDQAKMQECVVLTKSDAGSGTAIESSDDPRVIAVKEKMREMFPEAYVPSAFSLSPEEARLFDELASQGKEHGHIRNSRTTRGLQRVQHIETLMYEDSVMDGIAIHKTNPKRQVEGAEGETQPPSKKPRVELDQMDTSEKSRKPRRRPDKHELWDSGKLAVYIWSQRQKPGVMWDQRTACLQDPATGTWSVELDNNASPPGSIATILSSVQSARHIDASVKRHGHGGCVGVDRHARRRKRRRYRNQNNFEVPVTLHDVQIADGGSHENLDGAVYGERPFSYVERGIMAFAEQVGDVYDDSSETSDDESILFDHPGALFSAYDALGVNQKQWAELRGVLGGQNGTGLAAIRPRPSTQQPSKEKTPRDPQSATGTLQRILSQKWVDPVYGRFLRNLKIIRVWEQSEDGVAQGPIAPEYVYVSLSLEESKANMKPISMEWLSYNQFTADNIPDEIKNASLDDEEYGLSHMILEGQQMEQARRRNTRFGYNAIRHGETAGGGTNPRSGSPEYLRRVPGMSPTQPEGFIEYKTRNLTAIPKQPRGRFNKPTAQDDKLGTKREDELVAACVVFRTLLGGLDRNLDIGLLLKLFPGMSLSAIKKFWPRVSRERKSYVQALTAKFQSAFLAAYETDKLPPLDYDDIENYDWPRLILWATQLETHEDVDLPGSREALCQRSTIEDVTNEVIDWRETWFATTSTYNRIEAVASETMSIPLPPKAQPDKAVLERARTWVRSICCTSLRGVDVREKLIPRLLELGEGDAVETNRILEKAVAELNREKVITRTKGKDLGGNFRIHGMFSKQLEKLAGTPKFRQAMAFKCQLDEVFRHSNEFLMPYASDDGSIMAVLNLQAHGRIRMETLDMPNIPFGFEPGNYEGRTFPKSYYHFKVRLVPTEMYLFNEDMAILQQAQHTEPPTQGPGGKIPIWVDFFGQVNAARWADYVSMVVFTLATKGPIVPKMCVTLLKPMLEEFEAQLVIDWLAQFGLIQQAVSGCGVTGAEWWWLVTGQVVQASDKIGGGNGISQGEP